MSAAAKILLGLSSITRLDVSEVQLDDRIPALALAQLPQGRDRSALGKCNNNTKEVDGEEANDDDP